MAEPDILTVASEALNNHCSCHQCRTIIHPLAQSVIDLSAALDRYRWRPIAELHEDYGDCVLINIKDPGYIKTGSNLDVDFDASLWTHFSQITPLSQEEYERLKADGSTETKVSQP